MGVISRQLNPNRSYALDVFRGITLAGMILVNNPGGPQTYAPLLHAEWNGWTPTDLVFPSFAFILGVSLMYSLANRKAKTVWPGMSLFDYLVPIMTVLLYIAKILVQTELFKHAPKPALNGWDLLFPLILIVSIIMPRIEKRACEKGGSLTVQVLHHGLLLLFVGFTWAFDPTNPGGYRILGVLQRLALIYIFAGLIILYLKDVKAQAAAVFVLLASYWIIMKYIPVPGCSGHLTIDCNMAAYLDSVLLKGHLYRPGWEPEGLLHTIPSIATGLLGALAGGWLKNDRRPLTERMAGLSVAGALLLASGLLLNSFFPINKGLWTPSYVILCAGIDMLVLAVCVLLIDFWGLKRFATPFVVLGSNSIFIYLMSGFFIHYFDLLVGKEKVYEGFYAKVFTPYNASLAMALSYVGMWMLIGWLMYRKKVFIKL